MTDTPPPGQARRPDIILRVRRGSAGVSCMRFRAGRAVEPTTIGKRGAWVVSADGVQNLHVLIRFDGDRLFGMAAHPEDPPLVDGQALGDDWTEIPSPSVIAFGAARILVDDWEDAVADPSTATLHSSRGAHSASDRVEASGGASYAPAGASAATSRIDPAVATTRILDIARLHAELRSPPNPPGDAPSRPKTAAPRNVDLGKTTLRVDLYGASGTGPKAATTVAVSPAVVRRGGAWARFRGASFPKRATIVLLPFTFAALLFGRLGPNGQVTLLRRARAAPVSQAQPSAAKPPASAAPAVAPAAGTPSANPQDTSVAVAGAGSATVGATSPIGGSPPRGAPAAAGSGKRGSGRSLEREAADALAAGDYAQAARAYEALAAMFPDRPVFQRAARILKLRLDPGAAAR